MFFGVLWCSLAFFGVLWRSLAFFGVLWRSLVFFGVLWRSLVFFGAQCFNHLSMYSIMLTRMINVLLLNHLLKHVVYSIH